jgi:hypothetical protein
MSARCALWAKGAAAMATSTRHPPRRRVAVLADALRAPRGLHIRVAHRRRGRHRGRHSRLHRGAGRELHSRRRWHRQ